jgi:hypothetical protein
MGQLEFKPDDEEQENDTEFRNRGGGLRIADQPEARGPDGDARGKVAEHGAKPQQPEERYGQNGRSAKRQDRGQKADVGRGARHGNACLEVEAAFF